MQKFVESSFFSPFVPLSCVPKLLCPGFAVNFFKKGNKFVSKFVSKSLLHSKIKRVLAITTLPVFF